jgi:hypothetical protein
MPKIADRERVHVPGAEAPGLGGSLMSGLKPGPISEARAKAFEAEQTFETRARDFEAKTKAD